MLPLVVVLSIPTSLHLGRGAEAAGPASVPFLIASRVYTCAMIRLTLAAKKHNYRQTYMLFLAMWLKTDTVH